MWQDQGRPKFREARESFGVLVSFTRRSLSIKKRGGVVRVRNSLVGEVVGEEYLKLLLVQLDENAIVNDLDRLSLEGPYRRKVVRVLGAIEYKDLTDEAKEGLPKAIEKIVRMNELKWVDFFNKTGLFTHKVHTLELLPGISRKRVAKIIEEREAQPFTSFKDIEERTGVDPVKSIRDKLLEEIKGEAKYVILLRGDS